MVDAQPHTHLHDQTGSARSVEGVGEGRLEHGGSIVDPYKLDAHLLGDGYQPLLVVDIDAHLGRLSQIDIARVDINDQIGTLEILHNGVGGLLYHRAARIAGKDAVHIQIEIGNAAHHGVDAERVERRIDFYGAVERSQVLSQPSRHLVADHLPLQFVAVGTRHNAEALAPAISNHVFAYHQLFAYRQLSRCNRLYHGF